MKGGAARFALYLCFATKLTKSLRKITKGCTEFRVDKCESVETKPRNLQYSQGLTWSPYSAARQQQENVSFSLLALIVIS